MDWYPWYPALYKADTLDLTLEQDGAYRRLIDHYMETRLPLPDDNNALARIIGISPKDFRAIAKQLRSKFKAIAGELHSKRCDIELNRQDSLSKKRSEVAKAAHKKRNKNNSVQAIAEQLQSNCNNTGQDKTGQTKKKIPKKKVDFDGFWQAYPLKVGKGKAEPAYWKARDKAEHQAIMQGVENYKAGKPDYADWAHPASWLNAERWLDVYEGQDTRTPEEREKAAKEAATAKVQRLRSDVSNTLRLADKNGFDRAGMLVSFAKDKGIPIDEVERIAAELGP